MPEEITGTAPETAPLEVIAAVAQPESQPDPPEFQVERFTVVATFDDVECHFDSPAWSVGLTAPRGLSPGWP